MQTNSFRQKNNSVDLSQTANTPTIKKSHSEAIEHIRKLQKSQREYRRLKFILVTSFVVVAVGALMVGMTLNYRRTSPIPHDITSQVDFPLYYPTELPAGFSLDKNSFTKTNKVVTYVVTYEDDKKLIFNIQARPTNFDFDGFQSKGKKLKSSLGDAYIGSLGQNTVVSIATSETWVFIGVPSPIDTSALEVILQHLEEASY